MAMETRPSWLENLGHESCQIMYLQQRALQFYVFDIYSLDVQLVDPMENDYARPS